MENYLDIIRRMEGYKRTSPDRSQNLSAQDPPDAITIEMPAPNARPIYWEGNDGCIYGPACPEFLGQVGLGLRSTDFWVIADFEGLPVWIRSDRLRSKKAFDEQLLPKVIEVKEPK
jgi:hypothetical protein